MTGSRSFVWDFQKYDINSLAGSQSGPGAQSPLPPLIAKVIETSFLFEFKKILLFLVLPEFKS